MPMRTLPAPPQDQSTAMNAATPSIQDFVDRTRLVERRLLGSVPSSSVKARHPFWC